MRAQLAPTVTATAAAAARVAAKLNNRYCLIFE